MTTSLLSPPPAHINGYHDNHLQTGKMRKITVVIADDHPIVRKGMSSFLARYEQVSIVAEAENGRDAVRRARELTPDVVLMDIDMPEMNGLAATELLRREVPQSKVLILSMHRSADCVLRIIEAGACGYVLKDAHPDEILRAIETVHRGQAFFSPEVARLALNQFVRGAENKEANPLTSREKEVLVHIAEGLSNKEIAAYLEVGVRTVETHRERIMRKLNIHSVAGLTKYALAQGLISLPGEHTKS